MLGEAAELEAAYERGRQRGIVDEREGAIKAGVFRDGRYLTETHFANETVRRLRAEGFCPTCGADARS